MKTSAIVSGLLFELPIIIFFLTKIGLVTPEFLRKYRKYTFSGRINCSRRHYTT